MLKKWIGLLAVFWPTITWAAFSSTVIHTLPTQAVISFTAPDTLACTVRVSTDPSLSPLINDVNPALFPGSDSTARPGTLNNGADHIFIVGARSAPLSSNNWRYSRALETAATYYYGITSNGGQQSTGTFTTMSIPFGNNYVDPPRGDRARPGDYDLPTLDSVDRTKAVIDPLTGTQITRMTMTGDSISFGGTPNVQFTRGPAWQNPSNLTTANPSSVYNSTGKLFMGLYRPSTEITTNGIAYTSSIPASYPFYQLTLNAGCNIGGSGPSVSGGCDYSACITVDGVSCDVRSSTYTRTGGQTASVQTFGTTTPIDLWQPITGGPAPDFRDQGNFNSTANCDGSTTITRTGGDNWNTHWRAGSHINIGGTDYSIASVTNNASLTTTVACPTATNATVYAADFGVLVWKNIVSADTITINSATINYKLAIFYAGSVGGGDFGAPVLSTGTNGHLGYNFLMGGGAGGNIYWLDDVTGVGYIRSAAYTSSGCGATFNGMWYALSPDLKLCGSGAGDIVLAHLYASFDHPGVGIFDVLSECNTSGGNVPPYTSQQPCIVSTPLTPGVSLFDLAHTFTASVSPQYNAADFGVNALEGSDNQGNIIMQSTVGGTGSQGTLGWVLIFNPTVKVNAAAAAAGYSGCTSSTDCTNVSAGTYGMVGAGNTGGMIAALPSWARPGCRWCQIKGEGFATDGWAILQPFTPQYNGGWMENGPGTGPYTMPVIDGTANGTVNYFNDSTTMQACPSNSYGATGNNCTTVTVGSEPVSPNYGGGIGNGVPGELGPVAVGDYVTFTPNRSELMRLIKKVPGVSTGTWVETFQRGINFGTESGGPIATSSTNPTLYVTCNANQQPGVSRGGSAAYWDLIDDPYGLNTDGTTIPSDVGGQGDHYFWQTGQFAGGSISALETRCAQGIFGCIWMRTRSAYSSFQNELATIPNGLALRYPGFGGGAQDTYDLQSHPNGGGIHADASRFDYMIDGHPFLGGLSPSSPGTLIAGTLYHFTASQFPALDLPIPRISPTAAYSGSNPLIDISGPSSAITSGQSDWYKYCIAGVAGECYAGSAQGDVYVNAPYVRFPYCYDDPGSNLANDNDICIGGSSMQRDGFTQQAMNHVDNTGQYLRVLTKFVRSRMTSKFMTGAMFADGKWMEFESNFGGDGTNNRAQLVAKIPPIPAPDGIDRTTFIPLALNLTPPTGLGVTNAIVQFGYAENGPPSSYYCTTRQESCVAVSSMTAAYPTFQQTDTYSGVPCTGSCVVSIPELPVHTTYINALYRNSSNAVVATQQGIAQENAYSVMGGASCSPSCACSASTCGGSTCSDGCGGLCSGSMSCGGGGGSSVNTVIFGDVKFSGGVGLHQ